MRHLLPLLELLSVIGSIIALTLTVAPLWAAIVMVLALYVFVSIVNSES